MEAILLKQLVRQIKILNFWVTFFGVLFIATFAVAGILLWKAVVIIRTGEQKLSDLQAKTSQAVDVQSQLCSGSNSTLVKQYTDICK